MKTNDLDDHIRDALIRETTSPGAFVPLWKIADRISRYEPTTAWPHLVPGVARLEALGTITRGTTHGHPGQHTIRFEGLIVFDALNHDRIIFPLFTPGAGWYARALEHVDVEHALRIPTIRK